MSRSILRLKLHEEGVSITEKTIQRWEDPDDTSEPTPTKLAAWARATGKPLSWFYEDAPADVHLPVPDEVELPRVYLAEGEVEDSGDVLRFPSQYTRMIEVEEAELAAMVVPAAFAGMIRLLRPGQRMILQRYRTPQSLREQVEHGVFADGVYLVRVHAGVTLRRIQLLGRDEAMLLCDPAPDGTRLYKEQSIDLKGRDVDLVARLLYAEGD